MLPSTYVKKSGLLRRERAELFLNLFVMGAAVTGIKDASTSAEVILYLIAATSLGIWHMLVLIFGRIRRLIIADDKRRIEALSVISWSISLFRWLGLPALTLMLTREGGSPNLIVSLSITAFALLGILVLLQKVAILLYSVKQSD